MERQYITEALKLKKTSIAGWVQEKRDFGNLKFMVIRDRTGEMQVTLSKKTCPEEIFKNFDSITKESVVRVSGEIVKSEKAPNGKELIPTQVEVLSKSEQPVPIDISGKIESNLDTRIDWRFIDMRRKENLAVFQLEGKILEACTEFFNKNGFTQIATSRIVCAPTEGGTEYFPIVYFNKEAFLAQSPQFYKEIALASGLDRVCDMGLVYRAEPHHTPRHLCEYFSIDFEMAFIDSMLDVMHMEEKALAYIFKKLAKEKWIFDLYKTKIPKIKNTPMVTLKEAKEIVEAMGVKTEESDLTSEGEKALGEWALKKKKSRFVFLTRFPWSSKPFYVMKANDGTSESFDLIMDGIEITSGGQREHRYDERVNNCRAKGLNPESFDHLRFFKYGIPPHGGLAIGLERLTCKLLGLKNVREASLLPRDPDRLTP